MLLVIILLIIIILYISYLVIKKREEFLSDDTIRYNESIHVKGKVYLNTGENNSIDIKKLCIGGECIDAKTLDFVLNNKKYRNNLLCLDDVCIGKGHLKMLNKDPKDPKNNTSRELFSSMISIAKQKDIPYNNPSIGCSIKWK